jgi:hypothetical protein
MTADKRPSGAAPQMGRPSISSFRTEDIKSGKITEGPALLAKLFNRRS